MTDQLREFIEANPRLVTRRESSRYPGLFTIKYTRRVFYDALWNATLEECRGLVVDKDWEVVVRPFRKIYNRGERGADFPLDARVTAVRKVNGFMAAATWVPEVGQVVVSTTGSLDSPYVTLAEEYLRPAIADWIAQHGQGWTWLFEICDGDDPHIIPEQTGAWLIGARGLVTGDMATESGLDSVASVLDREALRPHHYRNIRFATVLQLAHDCHHEGFVVHHGTQSLKVKSPYYLVSKFLARMKPDRFLERINDPTLKQTVAEEFYPLIDHLRDHQITFNALNDEQAKLAVIRNFLETLV